MFAHSVEKTPLLRPTVAMVVHESAAPVTEYSNRIWVASLPAFATRWTVVFWPSFLMEAAPPSWGVYRTTAPEASWSTMGLAEAEEARSGRPATASAETAEAASPRFMPLLIMLIPSGVKIRPRHSPARASGQSGRPYVAQHPYTDPGCRDGR